MHDVGRRSRIDRHQKNRENKAIYTSNQNNYQTMGMQVNDAPACIPLLDPGLRSPVAYVRAILDHAHAPRRWEP